MGFMTRTLPQNSPDTYKDSGQRPVEQRHKAYITDSHHEESVVALHSKAEYENAINLSQHVPAAKIISEMVLDAFHTSKESDQIRELRVAIRQAHDAFIGHGCAAGVFVGQIDRYRRCIQR